MGRGEEQIVKGETAEGRTEEDKRFSQSTGNLLRVFKNPESITLCSMRTFKS